MSAFVVFSTPKNQYLYDRYSNAIVRITDEESIELSNILDGKILKEESRIYRELQKRNIERARNRSYRTSGNTIFTAFTGS